MICGPGAGRYFLPVYDGVDMLVALTWPGMHGLQEGTVLDGVPRAGLRCCEQEGWQRAYVLYLKFCNGMA